MAAMTAVLMVHAVVAMLVAMMVAMKVSCSAICSAGKMGRKWAWLTVGHWDCSSVGKTDKARAVWTVVQWDLAWVEWMAVIRAAEMVAMMGGKEVEMTASNWVDWMVVEMGY